MDQPSAMTREEWNRLESYLVGHEKVHLLRTGRTGISVFVESMGIYIHPKSFLELIEDLPCA
jgi:hypothetical protein